jgi:excisionase family DNA binding protein
MQDAWNVDQAANFLGLSPHTVRAYLATRRLPHFKIGARVLFDPTELSAWRAAKRVPTMTEELRARKTAAAGKRQPAGRALATSAG